jgi:single-strand DNA-binding protein
VGHEPEIRSTAAGDSTVAKFSLGTGDGPKVGQEWTDVTEWHSIVAVGRAAEAVRDYVKKGSQLYLEGKIQTRSAALIQNSLPDPVDCLLKLGAGSGSDFI